MYNKGEGLLNDLIWHKYSRVYSASMGDPFHLRFQANPFRVIPHQGCLIRYQTIEKGKKHE